MRTTATISAIGPPHGGKFVTHKMFTTGATMATAAEYADIIYEICFFHLGGKDNCYELREYKFYCNASNAVNEKKCTASLRKIKKAISGLCLLLLFFIATECKVH